MHNPDTIAAGDGTMETKLVFGDSYDFQNGATWSISGVVGPAEKVLDIFPRFEPVVYTAAT